MSVGGAFRAPWRDCLPARREPDPSERNAPGSANTPAGTNTPAGVNTPRPPQTRSGAHARRPMAAQAWRHSKRPRARCKVTLRLHLGYIRARGARRGHQPWCVDAPVQAHAAREGQHRGHPPHALGSPHSRPARGEVSWSSAFRMQDALSAPGVCGQRPSAVPGPPGAARLRRAGHHLGEPTASTRDDRVVIRQTAEARGARSSPEDRHISNDRTPTPRCAPGDAHERDPRFACPTMQNGLRPLAKHRSPA